MTEKSFLGFDRIRLKSFLPVVHISEYEAEFQPNEHASVYVKVLLRASSCENILEDRAEGQEVSLVELDEEGKEKRYPIFCGFIRTLRILRISEYYEAELFLVSGSWLLDREKKSRSFQKVGMTYEQVVDLVLEDTEQGASLYTADPVVLQYPLIQYQETDWEFLKRMASHVGGVLVPDTNMALPRIYVGMPVGTELEGFSETNYEILAERKGKTGDGFSLAQQVVFSYDVEDSRNASLGDNVWYKGKPLKIYRKRSRMERGELIHTYTLASPYEKRPEKLRHDKLRGMSLLGTVLETREDTLRLHLDLDEDQDKESAFFYPWRPETGNLMYCMPQVGTKVSLYLGNGEEGSAMAVNCIRTNGDSGEGMQDPSRRGLLTEHGKEMSFQKDSLGFYAHGEKEHSIVLDDEKGILIHSDGALLIQAKGNVTLSGEEGIVLSSPTEILALAGQDLLGNPLSGFQMNHSLDIGGERTLLLGQERKAYPMIQDAPERGRVDGFALFVNFAIGTAVTIVFVAAAVYTANVPLALGGISSGVKTVSITVKDGFGGNVRKPNEFLGAQLGASARSVYTGFAVQMGPVSVLGAGFLFGLGGVLERGIEGLFRGYGLKGSWEYASQDGAVLSDFTGGILFAGMTVALSKLLGAFWYGGGQENYYTKSLNPELPDKGYGLVPGGMQFPQGSESGMGNREVGAFLMNLWQISGRNQMFLPGNGSEGTGKEWTLPSQKSDILEEPGGKPTKVNYDDPDLDNIRSLTRENEAAKTLAKNGYNVEQNPKVPGSKNPDYLIENKVFDCYSPQDGTNVRNIASNIAEKVENGQADRIILNLDDWLGGGGNIDELINQLNDWPIADLKEVKIINHYHEVINIYP